MLLPCAYCECVAKQSGDHPCATMAVGLGCVCHMRPTVRHGKTLTSEDDSEVPPVHVSVSLLNISACLCVYKSEREREEEGG